MDRQTSISTFSGQDQETMPLKKCNLAGTLALHRQSIVECLPCQGKLCQIEKLILEQDRSQPILLEEGRQDRARDALRAAINMSANHDAPISQRLNCLVVQCWCFMAIDLKAKKRRSLDTKLELVRTTLSYPRLSCTVIGLQVWNWFMYPRSCLSSCP